MRRIPRWVLLIDPRAGASSLTPALPNFLYWSVFSKLYSRQTQAQGQTNQLYWSMFSALRGNRAVGPAGFIGFSKPNFLTWAVFR